jgi:serine O-acetyltransferase
MTSSSPSPQRALGTVLGADVFRYTSRTGVGAIVRTFVTQRTFRPVATLRLCQAFANRSGPARVLFIGARLAHRVTTQRAGVDLPWNVTAGPGLCINHGWGLVVSPGAIIGSNVTLFHGVTIGRRDRIGTDTRAEPEYPTIEDDVWIGPNAIVVGAVTVGTGTRVGGGAFVAMSVPPHCVVGGNPAQVLKTDAPADVFNRAPLQHH